MSQSEVSDNDAEEQLQDELLELADRMVDEIGQSATAAVLRELADDIEETNDADEDP